MGLGVLLRMRLQLPLHHASWRCWNAREHASFAAWVKHLRRRPPDRCLSPGHPTSRAASARSSCGCHRPHTSAGRAGPRRCGTSDDHAETSKKVLFGFVEYIIGATIVVAFKGLLLVAIMWLFQVTLVPRGLGWIVMPILGGVFGARIGYEAANPNFLGSIRKNLGRDIGQLSEAATVETRLWFAFTFVDRRRDPVLFGLDPFGRYRWSDSEWLKFVTILVGPVVVGFMGIRLHSWAVRKPRANTGHEDQRKTTPDGAGHTSAMKLLIERLAASGDLSKEEAAPIGAYHNKLLVKHNGDASAARLELINWLEGEFAARRSEAARARAKALRRSYDPALAIGFKNLPPGTQGWE